jgi:hypothetical protein
MNRADTVRAALCERRPTGKENRSNQSHPETAHLVQVRRRREASYRLPPYDDNLRDPMDGLAGRLPSRRSIAGAYFHLFDLGLMSPDMRMDSRERWRSAA